MAERLEVTVRNANENDRGFILSCWLRGQRFGCSHFEKIPQDQFYKDYSLVAKDVLSSEGVQSLIATDAQDSLWAVGFAVFKEPELFWVYVKPEFRRRGIAKLLLKGKDIRVVRSTTRLGLSIVKQKKLIYIPL